VLGAESDGLLMWHLVASFEVHPNMHGHMCGVLTMGQGPPVAVLTEQMLNTKSLTEGEFIAVDDMMPITDMESLRTCCYMITTIS
jgi:hypothetical protein